MSEIAPGSTLAAEPPHRRQLDGLRCFLFLWVFLVHANLAKFWYGSYALPVFFIVSGFLITRNILKGETPSLGRSLWIFYTRRVLRVFPVYYLICGILWFAGLLAYPAWHYLYVFNIKFFLLSLDGQQGLIEGDWVRNGAHFWSLSVEEQFYLIFPLTVWLTPKRFRLGMLCLLAASCTAMRFWLAHRYAGHEPRVYSGALLPVCGEYILFGCIIGYLDRVKKGVLFAPVGRMVTVIATAAVALGTAILAHFRPDLFERLPWPLWMFGAAVLAISALDLLIGKLIGRGRRAIERIPTLLLGWGGIAGSLVLFNIAKPTDINPYFAQFIPVDAQTLYAVVFTAVVWAVWLDPELLVSRVFALRPIAYLGKISYGLYLFHLISCWLALEAVVKASLKWPAFATWAKSVPEVWQWTIIAGPGLLFTVAFAAISWHLIEAPINNLKRFVPYGTED